MHGCEFCTGEHGRLHRTCSPLAVSARCETELPAAPRHLAPPVNLPSPGSIQLFQPRPNDCESPSLFFLDRYASIQLELPLRAVLQRGPDEPDPRWCSGDQTNPTPGGAAGTRRTRPPVVRRGPGEPDPRWCGGDQVNPTPGGAAGTRRTRPWCSGDQANSTLV